MLAVDEITIAVGAAVVLLAIISSLINPLLHRLSIDTMEVEDNQLPPISIIIPAHDSANALDRNLSLFLTQDYPTDYQVIVITEEDQGDTEMVLKKYANNKHLYTTYIPLSSRYMSRKKLQITLGVKAAKHEWIILVDPSCQPTSDLWLKAMSSKCTKDSNLILSYAYYNHNTSDYKRFEHILTAHYLLNKAINNTAYITNMPNIAFRKSIFLDKEGFLGNLHQRRGEYFFLVNKYADSSHTNVVLDRKAWLEQEVPSNRHWLNGHLFYLAAKKDLKRKHGIHAKVVFNELLPFFDFLINITIITYATILQNWVILGCAILALLLLYFIRISIAKKAIKPFDEDLPMWKMAFLEIGLLWNHLHYHIAYIFADKRDFTSHKL